MVVLRSGKKIGEDLDEKINTNEDGVGDEKVDTNDEKVDTLYNQICIPVPKKKDKKMLPLKEKVEYIKQNIDIAFDILRKSGIAKAQKKAGRSAKDGNVISYIHPGSKLGVLLEINCETDFVSNTEEFQQLGKDIAMHIAATNPMGVKKEDISEDIIEKEKEIYSDQAKQTNKPDNIIKKMVEGRINKFYKENI